MAEKENRTGLALAGALLSALAASLCCIGPFAAVMLGLAGYGASEFSARWRPYLLATTFVLLGVGFYLAYRPHRGETCSVGAQCSRKPLACWNRVIVWLAAVFVLAFAAFPYYAGRLVEAVSRNSQAVGTVAGNVSAHLVLKIDGMDCPVCAGALQKSLRQVGGVHRAEVSFQDKQATIDYDARATNAARFVKAITDAGFKVTSTQVKK